MAGVRYRVINPHAPRLAVDPNMRVKANEVRDDVAEKSPRLTGRLAGSWQVSKHSDASYEVTSDVPYAPYVEYGTRTMRGAHMVGRAIAKARS
jgi:hypothetical protein